MADAVTVRRSLKVVVTDGRGRHIRAAPISRWLVGMAPAAARGEVTVALVGDRKMRALNRRYRRTDRVTDVLSFPTAPGPWGIADLWPLGDIVIATGAARRQAREAGHSLSTELRLLALHGLLHLLGYDHKRDNGQMARLERRLLRRGGVATSPTRDEREEAL